ncbi:MAG: ABC transporter permease [Chordicoccus sp.]
MGAIYKKELKSYFTNMSGAVVIAVMLLVTGLMFRTYNMYYGVLTLHYTISGSWLAFLIVVPILSMRVFAEERKQRTDQLWMTAPVKLPEIVLGKYLAMVTVYAIPCAVVCIYPLVMLKFGSESLKWDYCCILGFFLIGAAYLAIGMFISSCTESAIISAILSLLFVLMTQLMSSIFNYISATTFSSLIFLVVLAAIVGLLVYYMTKNFYVSLGVFGVLAVICIVAYKVKSSWFDGRSESIMRIFDFNTHLSDITNGSLSISNLLFFISYIVIGIILTVQSIQKRRWS